MRLACWMACSVFVVPGAARADLTPAETQSMRQGMGADLMVVAGCKLRQQAWVEDASLALSAEVDAAAMRKMSEPGKAQEALSDMSEANTALSQAFHDGTMEWARYGQAACDAVIKEGIPGYFDRLVIAFQKKGKHR